MSNNSQSVFLQKRKPHSGYEAHRKKRVFSRRINREWTSVLIVSEASMLGTIQYIHLCTALTLMLAVLVSYGVFMIVARKHKETELLDREVHAAAGIYGAMYLIDLTTDDVRPLRKDQEIQDFLDGDYTRCRERTTGVVLRMAG